MEQINRIVNLIWMNRLQQQTTQRRKTAAFRNLKIEENAKAETENDMPSSQLG
ncbi:hypothetical protein PM082_008521 [Marasmius tenuissimus]|nr:hypothetical protein PM082_008521 [Marasmius tenuissimus]